MSGVQDIQTLGPAEQTSNAQPAQTPKIQPLGLAAWIFGGLLFLASIAITVLVIMALVKYVKKPKVA